MLRSPAPLDFLFDLSLSAHPALGRDLDGLVGDADIDEFTDQAARGGIPMTVDLDVIVGRGAATLPACKDVGLVRQFCRLETIDLGEGSGPAGAETAHLAGVEFDDEPADSGIVFRQGKKCVSAWNKDPVFGVIGIQSGPPALRVHTGFHFHGSRDWNAGRGDDC
jgi:hypothetical protein